MQPTIALRNQRDRAPRIHGRAFLGLQRKGHNKRGPGRRPKDSPHTGKRRRLTLRARLSKRLRQRANRIRRAPAVPLDTGTSTPVLASREGRLRSLINPLGRRG